MNKLGYTQDLDDAGFICLHAPDADGRHALNFEIGDWWVSLPKAQSNQVIDLLQGLLAESPFDPVVIHLNGDPAEIGMGGGPLDIHLELDRDGLAIDLYQVGQHTGSGATIPHADIPRFAAAAIAMSA